jgi:hypothetical protein
LEEITKAEEDISEQFEQCLTIGNVYSKDELAQDLQEVKGGGLVEDVGRYIGFGWKEFTREQNRIYGLAKLLFPVSERCYGVNHDAKLLCEN